MVKLRKIARSQNEINKYSKKWVKWGWKEKIVEWIKCPVNLSVQIDEAIK
jgi:hypothetical protein